MADLKSSFYQFSSFTSVFLFEVVVAASHVSIEQPVPPFNSFKNPPAKPVVAIGRFGRFPVVPVHFQMYFGPIGCEFFLL